MPIKAEFTLPENQDSDFSEEESAFLLNYVGPNWCYMLTSEEVGALLEPLREQRKFEEADRLLEEYIPQEERCEEHERFHDESWMFEVPAGREIDEDALVAEYGPAWRDEIWRINLEDYLKPLPQSEVA